MSEYSTPTVLVKSNGKKTKNKHELCNALSNRVNEHRKKFSQSNLQTETVRKVISLSNMQGQLFKCVVGTPIRFPRVL